MIEEKYVNLEIARAFNLILEVYRIAPQIGVEKATQHVMCHIYAIAALRFCTGVGDNFETLVNEVINEVVIGASRGKLEQNNRTKH